MSAQHTPGPWRAGSEIGSQRGIYTTGIELGGTGLLGLVNIYTGAEGQCDANARLISAAPDLLQALEEAVYETTHLSPSEDDGSHWCRISGGTLERARAALTKATGAT